jgi:DNA-binding winged helix-turn-helix (wHTH) protein
MWCPFSVTKVWKKGKQVLDATSSATEARRSGTRIVSLGIVAIVLLLVLAALFLFLTLPDANAFNMRVERLFVENNDLTNAAEIKLLEILAQSGTAFSDTLNSYRMVIFVLLVFSTAMLVAALVFLVMLVTMNRRMAQIEQAGIQVSSLLISRDENTVYLNNMGFKLTGAAMETLSVLAEARMDEDLLSGAEIEAMVSGKEAANCEEAAGATRIKRLRDTLGNQMVSELLVKNIARKGYMLAVDKDVIKMV